MLNDPLHFLFATINNASLTNKSYINIPSSKKNLKVLSFLYKQGLIRGYTQNETRINIHLKYTGSSIKPIIKHIQPISVKGRPFHANLKMLGKLVHANETFVISTPKGLLTLKEALENQVGGFIFCKIL
jgi:small subunit ribosomal protein S8